MGSTDLSSIHVLHGANAAYKTQDLLQQPGLEHISMGVPDQRSACAATQGISGYVVVQTAHSVQGMSQCKQCLVFRVCCSATSAWCSGY